MQDSEMPRFFFNIHEKGHILCDPEGTELATIDAARNEALADARCIMAEELRNGGVVMERYFEIANETGQVLATVHFQDALMTGLPSS